MSDDTNYMSMREYAHKTGVTYEAVRAQVAKYKKELEGHTHKEDGTKKILLDEYAIKFLQRHRAPRPVVITASDDETQAEIDRLNEQIKQLEAELRKADKEIIALHEAKEKLIADNARNETLLLLADKEHEQLEQTRQELAEHKADLKITQESLTRTKQELDTSTAELGKYHKSIFGFYRKDT